MLKKLGKLLKYEFRFYFRLLPPIYIAIMVMAFVVRIQEKFPREGTPFLLPLTVWGALITAMAVITIILIIQRFTDNFMKDPGALMFTLPVTVWALTASKAIAAFCMVLMSALAVFVSAIIFYIGTASWGINITASPIEIIVHALVFCFMIFFQICLIYTVITASHILPRFRFAAGCGMYLAIMYILQETVFRFVGGNAVVERGMHIYGNGADLSTLPIPTGIAALVLAALFFWATGFLLKRSYNLE
jgi:hypothetical protein